MKTLFEEIIKALKPLVDIADAYEGIYAKHESFYTSPEGTDIVTMQDCLFAREVTKEIQKRMAA